MSTLAAVATIILIASGVLFCLLAAVGMLRMPDVYTRIQAASKAATLGAACIVVATAIYFGTTAIATRALLMSLFLAGTAPIAAHMIGRVAYLIGVPLAEETVIDELKGRYDPDTHVLAGSERSDANRDPAG